MADLRSEFHAEAKTGGNQPAQRKALAERWIARMLDAITADGREPDEWEASELLAAIDAIERGVYAVALSCIEKAMMSRTKRSHHYARESATPSAAEIRTTLLQVRPLAAPMSLALVRPMQQAQRLAEAGEG